jgi:hypothetical protein
MKNCIKLIFCTFVGLLFLICSLKADQLSEDDARACLTIFQTSDKRRITNIISEGTDGIRRQADKMKLNKLFLDKNFVFIEKPSPEDEPRKLEKVGQFYVYLDESGKMKFEVTSDGRYLVVKFNYPGKIYTHSRLYKDPEGEILKLLFSSPILPTPKPE